MVQTDEVKDWGEWSAGLAVQGNWADSWKSSWTDKPQKTTERPKEIVRPVPKLQQEDRGTDRSAGWKVPDKSHMNSVKDSPWHKANKPYPQGNSPTIPRKTKDSSQTKAKPPHMMKATNPKSSSAKAPFAQSTKYTKSGKSTESPLSKSSATPSSRVSSVQQSRQPSRDGSEVKYSGTPVKFTESIPTEHAIDVPFVAEPLVVGTLEVEPSVIEHALIAIPESPKVALRASALPFVVKLPSSTPPPAIVEGPPSPTSTAIKCEPYQGETTLDRAQDGTSALPEYPSTLDVENDESDEQADSTMLVTEIPQALLNDLPPAPTSGSRLMDLGDIPVDASVRMRFHWVDNDILSSALNYTLAPEDLVDLLSPGYHWGSVYLSVEPTIISQGPDGKLFRKTLRGPALQAKKLSKLVKGLPSPTEFSAAFGNLVQLAIHQIYGIDVLKALVGAMTQYLEDFLGLSQLYTWESCLRLWLISAPDLFNGTPNIDRWYTGTDQQLESRMLVRKDQVEPTVSGRLA